MTIAQELEPRGRVEGLQKGLEKGRVEEKVKIARTMLQKSFDCSTFHGNDRTEQA